MTNTTSTSSTATSKTTRTSSVALQGLHLSEDWGFVGTPVLVEGNSFSAISPISVIFSDGSAPISVCETVSNAAGFFQCAMTVPSDVPAWLSDATITASDSMGNTASSPFTVVPSNLPSGTVGQVGQVINITTYGLLPIKGTAGPGGSHCVPLTAPCYYVKATITYNSQNGISIRYSASCVSSTNANPFQRFVP